MLPIVCPSRRSRADVYVPIVAVVIGLACSVYLFKQVEVERVNPKIGQVLFAVSVLPLLWVCGKEGLFCSESDIQCIYGFLALASLVVVTSVLRPGGAIA